MYYITMYRRYKLIFISTFGIILFSCGIKKHPKPPLKPNFSVKRIGEYVYVIPKESDISVKSFKYDDKYFYRKTKDEYCFTVKSPGKKKVKRCVDKAVTRMPEVSVNEGEDSVEIHPRGFKRYILYPFEDKPLLDKGKEFTREKIVIKRDFVKRCYALTGVLGNSESPFYKFCISPKPAPVPQPPRNLSITVKGNTLILVWSFVEHLEYVVYKNGKEVTRLKTNVFIDKLPDEETTYEVISVNELGKRSEPARITYRP